MKLEEPFVSIPDCSASLSLPHIDMPQQIISVREGKNNI